MGDKSKLIEALSLKADDGTLKSDDFAAVQDQFKTLIMKHRVWDREPDAEAIPA